MLYKGGPKNFSKSDWQVIAGVIGTAFVALITIFAATARPGKDH